MDDVSRKRSRSFRRSQFIGVILFLFSLLLCTKIVQGKLDPYEVLGLRSTASANEIKQAYKQLAREWHPDKNKKEEAKERILEINQAYDLLSDPKRKKRYDQYGKSDDAQGDADERNPFADFHFGNFGQFQYQFHTNPTFFTKHRIGLRIYDSTVVSRSYTKPYLIFIYADWCMSCMKAEGIWERVVNELEPLGYGIGTINSMLDGTLVERFRVRHLPSIVALVEGRVKLYDRNAIDVRSLVDFARDALPSQYVSTLTDETYRHFLDDNRRANKFSSIMFGPQDRPRLRYLLAAMRYKTFGNFGFICSKSNEEFRRTYSLSKDNNMEAFVLFNENLDAPVVTVQAKEIPTDSLTGALETHKFFVLPRLSSQEYFDELCPSSRTRLRLCAVLLTRTSPGAPPPNDLHLDAFRAYVENLATKTDRVRYAYLYEDRQIDFVNALIADKSNQKSIVGERRHVVLLWRLTQDQARVVWLREIWSGQPESVNRSAELLSAKIEAILKSGELNTDSQFSREVALRRLVDEHGPNLLKRITTKLGRSWDTLWHHMKKEEFFPAISVFGTLMAMVALGYFLSYAVESEKKAEEEKKRKNDKGKPIEVTNDYKNLLRELRAETYFGMVRMLKPGCRSIVVVVDEETKDVLIKQFARYVWPWRKNRTLLFGYVMVDKNLEWFCQLLEYTLPESSAHLRASVIPRNVVGTVLSLNGFRQYFCMYHPKHASSMVGFKSAEQRHMQSSRHFMGFDDVDSTDDEDGVSGGSNGSEFLKQKTLKRDELLDGLPNWLERLFEGSCRRYSIPEWPAIH